MPTGRRPSWWTWDTALNPLPIMTEGDFVFRIRFQNLSTPATSSRRPTWIGCRYHKRPLKIKIKASRHLPFLKFATLPSSIWLSAISSPPASIASSVSPSAKSRLFRCSYLVSNAPLRRRTNRPNLQHTIALWHLNWLNHVHQSPDHRLTSVIYEFNMQTSNGLPPHDILKGLSDVNSRWIFLCSANTVRTGGKMQLSSPQPLLHNNSRMRRNDRLLCVDPYYVRMIWTSSIPHPTGIQECLLVKDTSWHPTFFKRVFGWILLHDWNCSKAQYRYLCDGRPYVFHQDSSLPHSTLNDGQSAQRDRAKHVSI